MLVPDTNSCFDGRHSNLAAHPALSRNAHGRWVSRPSSLLAAHNAASSFPMPPERNQLPTSSWKPRYRAARLPADDGVRARLQAVARAAWRCGRADGDRRCADRSDLPCL